MKSSWLKLILIITFIFWPVRVISADTSVKEVSFVRCVDGDTAVFLVDGEEVKFRFLAIDTPETVHPTKEDQPFGKNASEYTCNKLTNAQNITVEYENSNKTDKYGRSLAWIWVDGSLLQKELVYMGYAEVAYIYGEYRYTESLCLVQKQAREGQQGLWYDKTEEGYCSTINLENVVDKIDYSKIGLVDVIEAKEEKEKADNESLIEDVSKFTDKINDYLVDNNNQVSKVFVYGFIAIACVYAIFKGKKK